MKDELTHIDSSGKARMVDVTEKPDTRRVAIAEGKIFMKRETLDKVEAAEIAKGDVLAVARIAGIGAAKHQTAGEKGRQKWNMEGRRTLE